MGNVNKIMNMDSVYLRRLYKTSCRAFKIENKLAKKGGVVFVGDSITDFCNLDNYYPGLEANNRGISGDTIEGILGRLDESIFGLAPSLVVIQGGTNNFQEGYDDVESFIIEKYSMILSQIKARLPETKVIVQSMYPVSDISFHNRYKFGHGHIESINNKLKDLVLSMNYEFADVYSLLTSKDEEFDTRYTDDGLHPNKEGYKVISVYLRPIINKLYDSNKNSTHLFGISSIEIKEQVTSFIEKVIISFFLLAIGVLFCVNVTSAVSITLGIILSIFGIINIAVICMGRKTLFSAVGIISGVAIAIGIAFCVHDLATVVVLLIPYILTVVGAIILIDAFIYFFALKQGGMPRFIVFLISGICMFVLGITLLSIEEFRIGYSEMIFGIILTIVATIILAFAIHGMVKRKKLSEMEK